MNSPDTLDLPTCRREIETLHQFFEEWFTGRLPQSEQIFARAVDCLAPEFHLVSPDGAILPRAQVIQWIWGIHAARPTDRLWVDEVQLRAARGDTGVVTYREWQETPAGRTLRLSTAVLTRAENTPHGLCWLHVHECWLATDTAHG